MEKIIKIGQVPLKIFIFLMVNDLLDTAGQLLMKKGLGTSDLSSVGAYFHYLCDFSNPTIFLFWLGLAIYVSNFILWMSILSKVDLSVALPLASSSYILIPLASVFFLHEFIPPMRWIALVLIVVGIYFVAQSEPKKEKHV